MTEIYVIKTVYERNATDGISYYTDKQELADAVFEAETVGGRVQVYKCVPIEHEVYTSRINIELFEE
jgi:hypothetical protein